MHSNVILAPLFAQILLTFIVWVTMYKTRVEEMKKKKIHPQSLVDKQEAAGLLKDSAWPANNFNNLFEIPVLFYLLTIVIYITQTADDIFLVLLSAFVLTRYIHSYIQITYNKIMHRFKVYFVSSTIVWVGWVILGYRLFA